MFPVEFAATKVEEWPRQQTEEINCAASSVSCPESGSELWNLNDNAGIGKALWYMKTCPQLEYRIKEQIKINYSEEQMQKEQFDDLV